MARHWTFCIPIHLESRSNQRQHWAARHRDDRRIKRKVADGFTEFSPRACWVDAPHPQRAVKITLVHPRLWDDDNVASALKPVIDALKCKPYKVNGEVISYSYGIVFDDSRKYARITFDQRTIKEDGPGAVEGVRVTVEE